jgi:chromosome partitioning protein
MAHIFTLTNAKGGCGKTTVVLNLSVCFARSGFRTLAIDLDQQGNLSAGLGVDLKKLNSTAHRLLINESPEIRRYLVEIRPQLHLLPNSIDIEADDLLEAKKVNRELLLRRQLKPILPDFDIVVIDTPPAMRAATVNALVVADSVIIPIDSSSFALLGMSQLLKTIAAISETHNPSLKISVLTTMFNKRQNLDKIIRLEGILDTHFFQKLWKDRPKVGVQILRPDSSCPKVGVQILLFLQPVGLNASYLG